MDPVYLVAVVVAVAVVLLIMHHHRYMRLEEVEGEVAPLGQEILVVQEVMAARFMVILEVMEVMVLRMVELVEQALYMIREVKVQLVVLLERAVLEEVGVVQVLPVGVVVIDSGIILAVIHIEVAAPVVQQVTQYKKMVILLVVLQVLQQVQLVKFKEF